MVTESQRKSNVRLIKRYANRKLYDARRSRYITLEGIRALVQEGEDVRVVDNDTGEDLTGLTFAQIIYESAKRTDGEDSLPLLRWLIQRGDEAVREFKHGVEVSRDAIESVREAAEKSVQKLVHPGGRKPGRRLLEDLLDVPQRRLDELQHRIDSQIRQSVEKVTKHPALRSEIDRVERSIRKLEERLGHLGKASPAETAAARPRRRKSVKKGKKTRKKAEKIKVARR